MPTPSSLRLSLLVAALSAFAVSAAGCTDEAACDGGAACVDGSNEMGDGDGDGFAACASGAVVGCDCDDADPLIAPDVPEVCGDAIDQNCDGQDLACDADDDGFVTDLDCDDADPLVFPGASETPGGRCDGIDNNCDGRIDEVPECRAADQDGDGVPACAPGAADTSGCDCNDCDSGIYGGASSRERCFGPALDEDCDGMVDEGCVSEDTDGDGQVTPQDCDDTDRFTRTQSGAQWLERCGDGVDQNCIPGSEAAACAVDTDADGWGEPDACEGDATINPDTDEVLCDGIDNDCDGIVDEVLRADASFGCADAERIDFDDNFLNCGGCRVLCNVETSDRCFDEDSDGFGTCDCAAEDGTGACTGEGVACCPSTGCVDLTSDAANCGLCGRACGAGESCVAGACG